MPSRHEIQKVFKQVLVKTHMNLMQFSQIKADKTENMIFLGWQ